MVKFMQKKKSSRTGKLFSRIFNVRQWSDWDRSQSTASYLWERLTLLFVVKDKKENAESFEAAKRRLNISDKQLEERKKSLYLLAWIMAILALAIFIYAIYQLFFGTYQAALISAVLSFVALGLFFRYHFWYFQIKNKKLGCTFSEWFYQGLLGRKS